ncbi:MAG: hypothetical protein JRJ44_06960 [Deltaproteobacteria bacterium]|nr:hypothetical protein [Deltaproteobacteria bacterium]
MNKKVKNNRKGSRQLELDFFSVSNNQKVSFNSNKVVSIDYYKEVERKELINYIINHTKSW